jgi:hypothetical protein
VTKEDLLAVASAVSLLSLLPGPMSATGLDMVGVPFDAVVTSVKVEISDRSVTHYTMKGSSGPLQYTSDARYDPATGQTKETLTQDGTGNKITSSANCPADPWLTNIGCTGGLVNANGDFKPDVLSKIIQLKAPVSAFLIHDYPDRAKIKAEFERARQEMTRKALEDAKQRRLRAKMLVPPTPTRSVLGTAAGMKNPGGFGGTTMPIATPTPTYPPYGAVYTGGNPPVTMSASQAPLNVSITVQNTSSQTWTSGGNFHLSYHWYQGGAQLVRDGERTFMPVNVTPGRTVNLSATVKPPPTPGAWALQWDMVNEGVAWFSDKGVPMSTPRNVNVVP